MVVSLYPAAGKLEAGFVSADVAQLIFHVRERKEYLPNPYFWRNLRLVNILERLKLGERPLSLLNTLSTALQRQGLDIAPLTVRREVKIRLSAKQEEEHIGSALWGVSGVAVGVRSFK